MQKLIPNGRDFHSLLLSIALIIAMGICPLSTVSAQQPEVSDPFLTLDAQSDDPLYTTYAAAMERSRLYGDKAYKMDYYTDENPLNYSSDHAGSIYAVWRINKVIVDQMSEYHKRPVVTASFPDMALLEYMPFNKVKVEETFFVYSSKSALVEMHITNTGNDSLTIDLYPTFTYSSNVFLANRYRSDLNGFQTYRKETRKRVTSNLYKGYPYPTEWHDLFAINKDPHSHGIYKEGLSAFNRIISDRENVELNNESDGQIDRVVLQHRFELAPGESETVRYIRTSQGVSEPVADAVKQMKRLKSERLQPHTDRNVELFSSVPRLDFETEAEKLVYLGAFNLARGNMMPPSGKTSHNFYVFSRNPKWGWGHGHQVLHESLSMIPYVYLDAKSAEGSQRVYMEQQGEDGLIAYRHGPRGPQTYPHKGEPTTSAPFYSWINWEMYEVTQNKEFLRVAYRTGASYVRWLEKNRDDDSDRLFEWGPYGLIENVRDWYNVIFQVSEERQLDVDKEDISDELEDLDLSLMVVNEMHYLEKMARELGKTQEANQWKKQASHIADLINETMWSEEDQFYYHIDKQTHEFQFKTRNLKRKEIIGFLSLWAEVAPKDRAEVLVNKHLTDTSTFWRKYGVPTLSASDPHYSAYVDQCCKWNGPVWLLWDYMVMDGLMNYGYNKEAITLADKMTKAVVTQLRKNHNFWESFSPDYSVINSPRNYIWDSIMAKVLIEKYRLLDQKSQ